MLLVRIKNSTEVVASKTHKLFAKMTPEQTDLNIVEAAVIKQMGEDLAAAGLEGDITIVKGVDVARDALIAKKGFTVKDTRTFGRNINNAPSDLDVYKPR